MLFIPSRRTIDLIANRHITSCVGWSIGAYQIFDPSSNPLRVRIRSNGTNATV